MSIDELYTDLPIQIQEVKGRGNEVFIDPSHVPDGQVKVPVLLPPNLTISRPTYPMSDSCRHTFP